MIKSLLLAATMAATTTLHAAELTEQENRWLRAAGPVLSYAKQLKLPVDIIVQPKARPGDVPLAMGFAQGRCKLVMSMRGNPEAESVLRGVPEAEQGVLIEAMTAHELAHCWRYAQGVWHALPSGFVEEGVETSHDPELLALSRKMRETRREEGFADLVALAWTQRNHPAEYARVHSWLAGLRDKVAVPHSGHDTRTWVRLAADGAQLKPASTPFEDAGALWREGLLRGD